MCGDMQGYVGVTGRNRDFCLNADTTVQDHKIFGFVDRGQLRLEWPVVR